MKYDLNQIILADCMDIMRDIPDKYFELAIVDPPYGIGEDGGDKKRNRGYSKIVNHEKKEWDGSIPDKKYFSELKRISENQVMRFCLIRGDLWKR